MEIQTREASQLVPVVLNLGAAVLGALGQYMYKLGGNRLGTMPIYRNWTLFAGMAAFCVVMVLFVISFKLGGRLSVTYPIYATTFVWGLMLAVWAEGEVVTTWQVAGVLVILAGVSLVAAGAR